MLYILDRLKEIIIGFYEGYYSSIYVKKVYGVFALWLLKNYWW